MIAGEAMWHRRSESVCDSLTRLITRIDDVERANTLPMNDAMQWRLGKIVDQAKVLRIPIHNTTQSAQDDKSRDLRKIDELIGIAKRKLLEARVQLLTEASARNLHSHNAVDVCVSHQLDRKDATDRSQKVSPSVPGEEQQEIQTCSTATQSTEKEDNRTCMNTRNLQKPLDKCKSAKVRKKSKIMHQVKSSSSVPERGGSG